MWEAWKLSQTYRTRPSELYGIDDEVTAWCFDRAVYLFGSQLDAELREASDGAKSKSQARSRSQRVLTKWLGGKQQFKAPPSVGGGITSENSGQVKL